MNLFERMLAANAVRTARRHATTDAQRADCDEMLSDPTKLDELIGCGASAHGGPIGDWLKSILANPQQLLALIQAIIAAFKPTTA